MIQDSAKPGDVSIPIIFHHGFMDVLNIRVGQRGFYSFKGIDHLLNARGQSVRFTRVHPTGSIQRRAGELHRQVSRIMEDYPAGTKTLLVAHSMGGLDARYMLAHLDSADRVAALLTISTPHRGTSYADYALQNMNRLRLTRLLTTLGLDWGAIEDLTCEKCEEFNAQTMNHPAVRYFSISAACEARDLPPWSRRAHHILSEREGANDGLVSVRSAMFAEHLETWPTNHWRLLNKRPDQFADDIVQKYAQTLDLVTKTLSA